MHYGNKTICRSFLNILSATRGHAIIIRTKCAQYRVISRNLKLGGYKQMYGGVNRRKTQIYTKNLKKTEKNCTESGEGGVAFKQGGWVGL